MYICTCQSICVAFLCTHKTRSYPRIQCGSSARSAVQPFCQEGSSPGQLWDLLGEMLNEVLDEHVADSAKSPAWTPSKSRGKALTFTLLDANLSMTTSSIGVSAKSSA